jgi:hypothetical protein
VSALALVTQMLVPSNATLFGPSPT